MSDYIKLLKQDIVKKIGVLEPYIYISEAECLPGKSGKGQTFFPRSECPFERYFPYNSVVPVFFQLETLMQLWSRLVLVFMLIGFVKNI